MKQMEKINLYCHIFHCCFKKPKTIDKEELGDLLKWHDGYERGLASMDFMSTGTSHHTEKGINSENQRIAEELHKPIIRELRKRKVYLSFKSNICGADLELIRKFNKAIRFLLYVDDMFEKYAWIVPLKDKKGIIITKTFQKVLEMSGGKPNKIWVTEASEFCNRSVES